MNPLNETISVDPVGTVSSLNVSLDVSSLGKKSQVNPGTPMPVGLQPQMGPQVIHPTVLNAIYFPTFKATNSDLENYKTAQFHAQRASEACDRARDEYNAAHKAWEDFCKQADQWTDFVNKVHQSPEEKELISQVIVLSDYVTINVYSVMN